MATQQEKLQQFYAYNFDDDARWKNFKQSLSVDLTNLHPTDPTVKKYKRKFYKLRIDPDFDEDVQEEPQSPNSGQQQEQQQAPTGSLIKALFLTRNGILSQAFAAISGMSLVAMIVNIFSPGSGMAVDLYRTALMITCATCAFNFFRSTGVCHLWYVNF